MSNGLDRIKALIGPQTRIATALGLTVEQVSRIANGKSPVPPYMDAVAELLEALPPKDWPERWRAVFPKVSP
jgi:transcriptional regulator with XRE-family HTH domain